MRRTIRTASTHVMDFDPKCKCGNHAVQLFEMHRVDNCLEEPTAGGFKCKVCLEACMDKLIKLFTEGVRECQTCGVAFDCPKDMVVQCTPLY